MKFKKDDIIETTDGNDDRNWVITEIDENEGYELSELNSMENLGFLPFGHATLYRKLGAVDMLKSF